MARNYERVCVSVPLAIRAEMDKFPEINWSAVASNAFLLMTKGENPYSTAILQEEVANLREMVRQIEENLLSSQEKP